MADNNIIDFYKKVVTDNELEEPLKEQKETPESVVSKSVSIPILEFNDPFDKFLFNLAEKLKTEKKITEQQQQQFNERVVLPTTNPEDPFAKFLESFAGLVKQDENINREENIKNATIDFINKLKNDDFFDYKKEESKEEVKLLPKKKPKKYLPPKFVKKIEKVEEDIPVIEQSTEPEPELTSNPYVKELQSTEKKKSKVEDKISGLSDIKKVIAQQVQEQLSKYPNLGFTGGGGGTNAVQYAQGGTMNGDLTVNGTVNASTFLSGGTNLLNLLSSSGGGGGGGFADRFVSGPSQFILDPDGKLHPLDNDLLTLQSESSALSAYTRIVLSPYGFFAYDNNSNSITFDSISDDIIITSQDLYEWTFNSEGKLIGPSGTLAVSGNVDVTNKFLSGGVDLADIFITSAEESQTLAYDTQTELLSITRGNSVSLSSLSDKSYANSNFLRLSGGTISGNLTIQGNISALGTATFANTIFTTTSALSVVNTGPGPALYVFQAAGPYDVASFYDGDGIEVLHVGNAGPGGFGKVGVNESFPNEELTVRGSISATEVVYAENGNSTNWNTAYQNVSSQSLNTTDSVEFSQVDVGGPFQVVIDSTSIKFNNQTVLSLDEATFYCPVPFEPVLNFGDSSSIKFYKPFDFSLAPDPAQAAADSRTSLGLGFADNVEFNQVNANVYLSGGVNLQQILGPETRQFDYVVQDGISYNYCGTAPQGSLTSDSTWTIKRLLFTSAGTLLSSGTVNNSIWDNRYSYSY